MQSVNTENQAGTQSEMIEKWISNECLDISYEKKKKKNKKHLRTRRNLQSEIAD